MKCPHCKSKRGHYSAVTYKPIDDPKNPLTETYWFCHICAKLVYEADKGFMKLEK